MSKGSVARQLRSVTSPLTLARDNVLPLDDALATVMPGGVLRRGTSVVLDGVVATSLALGLASRASVEGSWVAFVGLDLLCLPTAEEFGLDLTHVALVDDPGDQWANVMSTLVGAIDVVVTSTPERIRARDGRRLAARLRERGSVIIELKCGPRSAMQGDVVLSVDRQRWYGLGWGHGCLRSRRVTVNVSGRGAASMSRAVDLLLPGDSGRPEAVEQAAAPEVFQTYDTVADVADLTARLATKVAARTVEAGA
ncbi:MAG: hypothetical protein GY708_11545 [Actinomycetia bacterium]|nr:hypothetical protein [Actinomycetes bacterium]MCP4959369.1 hypothetical protein [Actinomycetes bacterium]